MTLAYSADAAQPRPRRADLCSHLRLSTTRAHEELEHGLALVSRVADRQWFLTVLDRFYGFHSVWERAIGQRALTRAFHEPRSRLPHLRRDLVALGRTTSEIAALEPCRNAAGLVSDPVEAIGSIYVMEGSTLGGQVIARALAAADWVPPGGLAYFHPYGGRTGEMWRSFRAWADARVAPEQHEQAAAGANRTFERLREWLTA